MTQPAQLTWNKRPVDHVINYNEEDSTVLIEMADSRALLDIPRDDLIITGHVRTAWSDTLHKFVTVPED